MFLFHFTLGRNVKVLYQICNQAQHNNAPFFWHVRGVYFLASLQPGTSSSSSSTCAVLTFCSPAAGAAVASRFRLVRLSVPSWERMPGSISVISARSPHQISQYTQKTRQIIEGKYSKPAYVLFLRGPSRRMCWRRGMPVLWGCWSWSLDHPPWWSSPADKIPAIYRMTICGFNMLHVVR